MKAERGVIFDHDGTLVHSEQNWFAACQKALNEHGVKLLEEHRVEISGRGRLSVFLVERFKLTIPAPILSRRMSHYFEVVSEENGIVAAEGAVEAIKRLSAEFPLAIASGSHTEELYRTIETLGISSNFKALIGGEQVLNGKPAPDIYLKAAEKLGIPPDRCTAIEDSNFGISAAKKAGMRCIAIPDRMSPIKQDLSFADFRLNSLNQLTREHILNY